MFKVHQFGLNVLTLRFAHKSFSKPILIPADIINSMVAIHTNAVKPSETTQNSGFHSGINVHLVFPFQKSNDAYADINFSEA